MSKSKEEKLKEVIKKMMAHEAETRKLIKKHDPKKRE